MKNLVFSLISLTLLASCSHRVRILDAGAVSMTKYSLKKGQSVVEKDGEAEGRFCSDPFKQSGQIGLMDEAIKDAQKSSNADFLRNVTVYKEANCVIVTGTPLKVVAKKRK